MKKASLILLLGLALTFSACKLPSFLPFEKTEAPTEASVTETEKEESGEETKRETEEETSKATEEETTEQPSPEILTDTLEKSETLLTNYDVFRDHFFPDAVNHMLVIYVSFKGEPALDRAEFEKKFTDETDAYHSLYSVSSYFKHQSYGRDLLDFQFAYYDSPMTVEEAWHYVNDEDAYGNFRANRYLYEIFNDLKAGGAFDTTTMDADRNGYVDAVFFVMGDRPSVDNCYIYGGAQGHTASFEYRPDPADPTLGQFVKMSADYINKGLRRGSFDSENTRMILHETGHLFGLMDYYDFTPYEGEIIDSLGCFDMQDHADGDWNVFSKFSCGWLTPYVITEDMDEVTIELHSSSVCNEAILIPTSKGWNGTAFDEYLLVEVMAPEGATEFDWSILTDNAERMYPEIRNKEGGVRILHVDARVFKRTGESYVYMETLQDFEKAIAEDAHLLFAHTNSNGYEPHLPTDSRFYHQIDWIPADGTQEFRLTTPTNYSVYTFGTTNDLFTTGERFSTESHSGAFPNGTQMNNGGTVDYTVEVLSYDETEHSAIVRIKKIK